MKHKSTHAFLFALAASLVVAISVVAQESPVGLYEVEPPEGAAG